MTYIEGADFFVRIVRLPVGIRGALTLNEDGTYNLYLSDLLDYEQRIDTYTHEYWHIIREDFWNGKPIWVIEEAS